MAKKSVLSRVIRIRNFQPLGDSAVVVEIEAPATAKAGEFAQVLLMAQHALQRADLPGVIEIAPAYTTLGIFYDPLRIIATGVAPGEVLKWLQERIETILSRTKLAKRTKDRRRVVEIPVCYASEFGPDLADVTAHTGRSADEIIRLHAGADYLVQCLGFTPGFPFLSGLPEALATPRRDTPRTEVPAGSVAIGGKQTGVYPLPSPGGWNIIGRTPLHLFDPKREDPASLRAGDRVRFRPISRSEFDSLGE